MAKYQMDTLTGNVYRDERLENVEAVVPVIVIPEGDWRRLVEFINSLLEHTTCSGTNCEICREDAEIKEIVSRVEDANG